MTDVLGRRLVARTDNRSLVPGLRSRASGRSLSGSLGHIRKVTPTLRLAFMDVQFCIFPETSVAAVEHHGSPDLEHQTARRLIDWRIANGLAPGAHAAYGVHYTDPRTTPPAQHRVDFCIAFDGVVAPNPQGVVSKAIPGGRCAVARHLGPRDDVVAARHLFEVWLPASGEKLRDFPVFFHYVNVGPDLRPEDMITDVYLPLE